MAGAEYADSLGADIINSSLGYTTFNDTSMNYSYADLNGRTSRASRAADIAFAKGMIVVNSAGNSGGDEWRYIGTPADAFYTLAVGATDFRGQPAYFSSRGPTADGRIKPNVSAMGKILRWHRLVATRYWLPTELLLLLLCWREWWPPCGVHCRIMAIRRSFNWSRPPGAIIPIPITISASGFPTLWVPF